MMPHTSLLFVNKDVGTFKHPDARERSRIHRHVQLGRQRVHYRFAITRTGNSLPAPPGRNGWAIPDEVPHYASSKDEKANSTQSSFDTSDVCPPPCNKTGLDPRKFEPDEDPSRVHSSHQQQQQQQQQDYLASHPDVQGILEVPLSEDRAMDPFDAACVPLNAEVHRLLQYFVRTSHPNIWYSEARNFPDGSYSFQHKAGSLVVDCLQNEANMYSLLASMSSQATSVQKYQKHESLCILMQKALVALQEQIITHGALDETTIFNMYHIGAAEFFRGNHAGCLVHLQGIKTIVGQLGGLRSIDEALMETILHGDGYLAAELLSKPVFSAAEFDSLEKEIATRCGIEEILRLALEDSTLNVGMFATKHNNFITQSLRSLIGEISLCLYVQRDEAGSGHGQPSHVRLRWMHLRVMAIRHRLLALELNDGRANTIRIALLIWVLMAFTMTGLKRTSKIIAPKLAEALLTVDEQEWNGHEELHLWILTVGAMAASAGASQTWFEVEILKVSARGSRYLSGLITSEGRLVQFSEGYFYLEPVQRPLIQELTIKLLKRLKSSP